MLTAATTGFFTALSLILAIGAQNTLMLRQGLMGAHVFWLCLFFAISDAVLITAGIVGVGALVTLFPAFPTIMVLLGAGFLLTYGALRLIAAYRGNYQLELSGSSAGLGRTLATAAAFTWLNPHVYLDTLGLIGAVSTGFRELSAKWAFGIGAVSASFLFFFSLGYGSKLLAPIMASARAWRGLDILVGITMWAIALGLVLSHF